VVAQHLDDAPTGWLRRVGCSVTSATTIWPGLAAPTPSCGISTSWAMRLSLATTMPTWFSAT